MEYIIIPKNVYTIENCAINSNCNIYAEAYDKGSDWNSNWNNGNDSTTYWYRDSRPSETGNYWHYYQGVPVIWGKEYAINFELNGGRFLDGYTAPDLFYYGFWYNIPNPYLENSLFIGWMISNLDGTTHYIGNSETNYWTTSRTSVTDGTNGSYVMEDYFKNLRESYDTVSFVARYVTLNCGDKVDIVSGTGSNDVKYGEISYSGTKNINITIKMNPGYYFEKFEFDFVCTSQYKFGFKDFKWNYEDDTYSITPVDRDNLGLTWTAATRDNTLYYYGTFINPSPQSPPGGIGCNDGKIIRKNQEYIKYRVIVRDEDGYSSEKTEYWSYCNIDVVSMYENGYDISSYIPTRPGYKVTGYKLSNMDTSYHYSWNPDDGNGGGFTTTEDEMGISDLMLLNLRATFGTVYITWIWTPNIYTITYHSNLDGDSSTMTQNAFYGMNITLLGQVFTKYGYTISNWNTRADGKGKSYIAGSTTKYAVMDDIELYAIWTENGYKIIYDLGGGEFADGVNYATSAVYGEWFTVPIPVRFGYQFVAWQVGASIDTPYGDGIAGSYPMTKGIDKYFGLTTETIDYTIAAANNSGTETLNAQYLYFKNLADGRNQKSVGFKAVWRANIYNITYEYNGGDSGALSPAFANYGVAFSVSNPVREGYTFKSWYISGLGSNIEHFYGLDSNVENSSTQITLNVNASWFMNLHFEDGATITFKAEWEANQYNIIYDLDGGTFGTIHPSSAAFDSWFSISNPTKAGYRFNGWAIGKIVNDGYGLTLGHLKYVGTSSTSFVELGNDIESFYENGVIYTTFKNLRNDSEAVAFKATWVAISYNLVFELNGGTIEGAPTKANFDTWFYIPSPTDSPLGYNFKGWVISGMAGSEHYIGTSTTEFETVTTSSYATNASVRYFKNLHTEEGGTVTLSALYEALTYNIDYELDGGTYGDKSSIVLAYYDAWFDVDEPTKVGYTFSGWKLNDLSDKTSHFYKDSSSKTIEFNSIYGRYIDESDGNKTVLVFATAFKNLHVGNGTVKLTATWVPNIYTITYHFMPSNTNAYQMTKENMNLVSNMTLTRTQNVTFDTSFKVLGFTRDVSDTTGICLPNGVKLMFWVVNDTGNPYSSSTNLVSWSADGTGANSISGQKFGIGEEIKAYTIPNSIHVYATYTIAKMTVKYFVAESDAYKNDVSHYVLAGTDTVDYLGDLTLRSGDGNIGWMISANNFTSGKTLTEESITEIVIDSTTYRAEVGNTIVWVYSNTDAYDYAEPVYYIYAVYAV